MSVLLLTIFLKSRKLGIKLKKNITELKQDESEKFQKYKNITE